MEVVREDYLLDMGFTKGFVKTHAVEMGSLRTRPRLFNKERIDAFLMDRSNRKSHQENKIERHRQILSLVEHVIQKRSHK